jgi:hypothetical protein
MLAVELSVYRADGRLFDRGTAVVKDLSVAGAMIIAIVLARRSFPLGPHTIGLRPLAGSVLLPEIVGRTVRFVHAGESVALGVEFLEGYREPATALYKRLRSTPRMAKGQEIKR